MEDAKKEESYSIRVSKEMKDKLEEVKTYMESFSYNSLEVSFVEASRFFIKKMEMQGALRFLK